MTPMATVEAHQWTASRKSGPVNRPGDGASCATAPPLVKDFRGRRPHADRRVGHCRSQVKGWAPVTHNCATFRLLNPLGIAGYRAARLMMANPEEATQERYELLVEEKKDPRRHVPSGLRILASALVTSRIVATFRRRIVGIGWYRGEFGIRMNTEPDYFGPSADSLALWALVSAALGLVAVIVAYWMIIPAVLLGLVAVIVGVIARQRAAVGDRARDIATVAVCLGAVAMLFTPVILTHTSAAEDWGRDCALHPEQDENCPRVSPSSTP